MKTKEIKLESNSYTVVENKNDCLNIEELEGKYTDYFNDYDYILGDYAYNKLRLKGFCDKQNKKCNNINNINIKDKYLKELCAYECNYFLIKKINQ
ncbi:MAG: YutD family protein [Bacilli bacterium]|nr:YutD family protein [Bacilli bacterium]